MSGSRNRYSKGYDNKVLEDTLDYSLIRANAQVITDTNAHNIADGFAIQALEDTVIAAISYEADANSNTLVGETVPAGVVIYLNRITSLTLTSGACLVYQRGKH